MIARQLIQVFCEEYELPPPTGEYRELNLAFEGGFLICCLPSWEDTYVRLVCSLEQHRPDDTTTLRRILELQPTLDRDYHCVAALEPYGGSLYLSAIVDCSGVTDSQPLSLALDRMVSAARWIDDLLATATPDDPAGPCPAPVTA